MKEHFDDVKNDDYEKRIQEKLEQKARELEQEIEADPGLANAEPGDSLDRKIEAALAACKKPAEESAENFSEKAVGKSPEKPEEKEAEPAGLSEEDLEALRLGRELQKRSKDRRVKSVAGRWKRIAAALVVLLLVAGVGIPSIGGANRIVSVVKNTLGGRDSERINSSKDTAMIAEDVEEEQAYQQIRDELGIEPVRMVSASKDMEYKYCEVDPDIRMAQMLYEYGDRNISYLMDASYTTESLGTDIEDEITDEYSYKMAKAQAEVTEYELAESGAKRYTAKFEYQGVYYQLTATIDKEIFEKILDNLYFP